MSESLIMSLVALAILVAVIPVLRNGRRKARARAEHRAAHAGELRQHLGQRPERDISPDHTPRFEGGASAGQRLGGGKRTWGSQGFPK